jgi:hypothetical protein
MLRLIQSQAKSALVNGVSLGPDSYVFSHEPDASKPIRPDGVSHRFRKLADCQRVQDAHRQAG